MVFRSKLLFGFFQFQTIVDKTNVTLQQSLHSILINELLTQRETGFSTKEPTIRTLQR